jgi:hypothetical protein
MEGGKRNFLSLNIRKFYSRYHDLSFRFFFFTKSHNLFKNIFYPFKFYIEWIGWYLSNPSDQIGPQICIWVTHRSNWFSIDCKKNVVLNFF